MSAPPPDLPAVVTESAPPGEGAPASRIGGLDGGADPWAAVPAILARIVAPTFPGRDFPATVYGARGDGRTDDQAALQRAVDACADAGGGRVVVPAGDYPTGPLRLRSGVNLHVAEGAVLRFAADSCRYRPPVVTRWEGVECLGLAPFLYAHGQCGFAITGRGTLDGQAGPGRWWDWAGPWDGGEPTGWHPDLPDQRPARARLQQWGESGVPVPHRILTDADRLRPMFAEFYRCRDVLVEGVTFRNAPMWVVHPVLSRSVTVRRISVSSHGPNNDGCVADSSRDVLVEDCTFDTGDDCVAVKAGRNRDGWRVGAAAEDIVIRRCRMRAGHSAVAIGSEISGGIRRVFVEGCTLDSPHLDHVLRVKGNSTRGGIVEQIHLRECAAIRAREAALAIDLRYDEAAEQGQWWPRVRQVTVDGLDCEHSGRAVWIEGLPALPVRGVRIQGCRFGRTDAPDILRHVEDLLMPVAGPTPARTQVAGCQSNTGG